MYEKHLTCKHLLNTTAHTSFRSQNDGARYRRQAEAARREISKLEEEVQKLEPANIAHLEEGRTVSLQPCCSWHDDD